MASFDYRLNPLYLIKECSSCGALYTTNYCCIEGSLRDKIICDLNKTPDLSQLSPQNCPKYGNPIDDSSEPSNDNTNVVNALQDPFVVNQDPGKNSSQSPPQINHHCCYGCGDSLEDIFCHQCTCELCGKGAHYGYNCPLKVPIIPDLEPFNNQTVDELPQTVPSFNPTCYSEDGNSFTYDPKSNLILVCYDDDDDEDCTIAITNKEPNNSLSMEDEHLDIIPATESDEFIKSSVENLVPNPSESEGEYECDVSAYEDITTLFNILFDTIPPGINESDCNPEEEIRLIKRLLYDNSSPRPSEEFISKNSDTAFKSFSSFPIPIEDSGSFMEEIDLSFTPNDPMPPGIEKDDYDSERDILILEELLSNDSLSLPENESFYFDIPLSSRPSAKPSDGNSRILNVKVMGDISEHKVPMPRLMFTQTTLVPNQEKSPNLLPHLGHEASQPSAECPMMIYGKNTPILDVLFFHFYPP
nr:hypothetical protein [Tanacetum cinerariifolium]